METIILLMIFSIFLELLYFIYEDKVKKFIIFLYGIITKDSKIYYVRVIADFLINIGPSISAVSVAGFFIPIKGVSVGVVFFVLFLGLGITLFGAFVKRKIK